MTIESSQVNLKEELRDSDRSEAKARPINAADFIHMTAQLLEELIEVEGYDCKSIFNSNDIPLISIHKYLQRLLKIARFSPKCLVIAVIYFDRYNMADPEFTLNKNNVHRFFLACITLAVKYQDDIYFDNLTFEKAGGVPINQLMAFELQIFGKLSFRCFVGHEEYEALEEKLYSLYTLGLAE